MLSEPVRKRSVASNEEIWPPLKILELAKLAYEYPFYADTVRLSYATLICLLYLGALRINEALRLYPLQFKRKLSLDKKEFFVVENVPVEKSGGKVRNVAICPSDPLARVMEAHLKNIEGKDRLFTFTRMTAWNIVNLASGGDGKQKKGEAWPHFFKAQRDRFLAQAFDADERRRIVGWSRTEYKPGQSFRSTEERYSGLNWMFYADRLAKLTESYWQSETISPAIKSWLDSLSIIPTTPTT